MGLAVITKEGRKKMKECPYCAEEIQDNAIKCKHCKEFLNKDQQKTNSVNYRITEDEYSFGRCTDCKAALREGSDFCPECGVIQINITKNSRKCHQCGYIGTMKTWLRNYNFPQFIIILGLFFFLLPGIIFWAWGWGKYKCPSCGALAKNSPATYT